MIEYTVIDKLWVDWETRITDFEQARVSAALGLEIGQGSVNLGYFSVCVSGYDPVANKRAVSWFDLDSREMEKAKPAQLRGVFAVRVRAAKHNIAELFKGAA